MDINVVVKLALDKCISIYNEMASEKLEMGESGRIYGRIPKVLIIKYGDGYWFRKRYCGYHDPCAGRRNCCCGKITHL